MPCHHAEPVDRSEDDIRLGASLDVSLLGWYDVDHRHRKAELCYGRMVSDDQPAALVLKPGYIAPRPNATSMGGEKGLFKSSRYIRLLVACFVASYPFFIPPYVSVGHVRR